MDGEVVWPPPRVAVPAELAAHPRPRLGPAAAHRLRVVPLRQGPPFTEPKLAARLGIDALDAFAVETARRPREEWPDALLLLGDQVYADELTPQNRRRIAGRRDRHPDWPDDEIVGFDEYVGLYRDSWGDPEVRWLLSCVPTGMIFDDHDVRDDWNTSGVWRAEMAEKPWWRARIRSALASYWVYQHLGNLPAEELAADPDFRAVTAAEGDTWPLLAALADRADAEVDGSKGVRFSFRWDLGATRFIMIDSRNGRILDDGAHLMLGEEEFAWIEEQVATGRPAPSSTSCWAPRCRGCCRTRSATCRASSDRGGAAGLARPPRRDGPPGRRPGALAGVPPVVRPAHPDDHGGCDGPVAPATVSVLSGDVHHSYAARVDLPGPGDDPGRGRRRCTSSPARPCTTSSTGSSGPCSGWAGRGIARLTRRWAAGPGCRRWTWRGTSSPGRCSATRSPRSSSTGGTRR